MTRDLIVKLRPQARVFEIDVQTRAWRIESSRGFSSSDLEVLNSTLQTLQTLHTQAGFGQSFPRFVARLRGIRAQRGLDGDPKLALFLRLKFPRATERSVLDEVAERLAASGSAVDYVDRASGDVAAQSVTQGYVEPPASGGVNAVMSWDPDLPGGRGEEVSVCLVDHGCHLHGDFPAITALPEGALLDTDDHGTQCLGVIVTQPGGTIQGIAHAARAFCSSTKVGVPTALDVACEVFEKGDVILVPREGDLGRAYELLNRDVLQAIFDATTLGIVVVASAGNGNADLDTVVPVTIEVSDGLVTQDVSDSGSIIVGAGFPPAVLPATESGLKYTTSSFGKRVNCQGWGESVGTAGGASGYATFQETSAAASIVAGVAAVVQSVHKAAHGGSVIPPAALRDALSLPANGLPQPPTDPHHIGPLPDIQRVLRHFALLPDCFLRDDLADDGTEPSPSAAVAQSPDVIVRNALASPADIDGWIVNWDSDYGESVTQGKAAHVYLRVQNRGPFPDRPQIDLYWAYPGTCVTPVDWNFIGRVEPDVPGSIAGGNRIVSAPLDWTPPWDTTHPCLIAVLQSKFDIAPIPLTAFSSDAEFIAFLSTYNNVTMRNLILIGAQPSFVCLQAKIPRMQPGPIRIRIGPDPPPFARWFLGLPRGLERSFFVEGGIVPRRFDELVEDPRAGFGLPRDEVLERLRRPLGDRRELSADPPALWFAGIDGTLEIELKRAARGQKLPLVLAVAPMFGTSCRLKVEQFVGTKRVGQITLATASSA